ncbi:MAG: hypothetical protein ABSH44_05015 [Bryobacteraceae bacterium]|jgi:hypothetical protein
MIEHKSAVAGNTNVRNLGGEHVVGQQAEDEELAQHFQRFSKEPAPAAL